MPAADPLVYVAYSIPDDSKIGEVPFTSFEWAERLNRPGTFAGSLPYWHRLADELDAPGTVAIYVEVGGLLKFGGIVWLTDLDPDRAGHLRVSGEGFMSYYGQGTWGARRTIRSTQGMTYATNPSGAADEVNWATVDQFRIVGDVLDHAATIAGAANVGYDSIVYVGPGGADARGTLSGATRDRVVWGYERRGIAQEVYEMAAAQSGFDWSEAVAWDTSSPPVPERTLTLWAPRRGSAAAGATLAHGQNVSILERTRSADDLANPFTGLGAGVGPEESLSSEQVDLSYVYPAGPYPFIEGQARFEESIQANLDRRTAARLVRSRAIVDTIRVEVEPTADLRYGDLTVGDSLRTIASLGQIDLDDRLRLVEERVQAGAEGIASWELSLATEAATLGEG